MTNPDPLAPARRLADTSDLTGLPDAELERRAQELTAALKALPDFHADLRRARQAVAVELHKSRRRSFGDIGKLMDITRGRAKQIVDGQTKSGSKLYGDGGEKSPTSGG
jgi:DNA-directed RNA polymerase sigma subunit (sigma70/sigma32)